VTDIPHDQNAGNHGGEETERKNHDGTDRRGRRSDLLFSSSLKSFGTFTAFGEYVSRDGFPKQLHAEIQNQEVIQESYKGNVTRDELNGTEQVGCGADCDQSCVPGRAGMSERKIENFGLRAQPPRLLAPVPRRRAFVLFHDATRHRQGLQGLSGRARDLAVCHSTHRKCWLPMTDSSRPRLIHFVLTEDGERRHEKTHNFHGRCGTCRLPAGLTSGAGMWPVARLSAQRAPADREPLSFHAAPADSRAF
jgi:hypothetical protein